ncbi:MAG: hypothetical protein R2800_10010 [Flavipsychrobacter sp.]
MDNVEQKRKDTVVHKARQIIRRAELDLQTLLGHEVEWEVKIGETKFIPQDVIDEVAACSKTSVRYITHKPKNASIQINAIRQVAVCLVVAYFPMLKLYRVAKMFNTSTSSINHSLKVKDDYIFSKDDYFYPVYLNAKAAIQDKYQQNETTKA